MTTTFPWRSAVQLGLEAGGIVIAVMMSGIEGAQTGGIFLMLVHIIFFATVLLGMAFYYNSYTYRIARRLRFVYGALYMYCLLSTGLFFYFMVRISDPNMFDIVLTTWGGMMYVILFFYVARLMFFTYYAEELYGHIIGRRYSETDKEMEEPKPQMVQVVQEEEKPKVPLYLMDYEKMFGKK